MKITRRHLVQGSIAFAGAATMAGSLAHAADAKSGLVPTSLTPDEVLARLVKGNQNFVADKKTQADISSARRLALANGQAPICTVVGCADSRVSLEHLFAMGLGEMFVVRTAGNYVDTVGFGSIAYSVAALKVPLIVVLGHERCGAVAAAKDLLEKNTQLPPALTRMVEPILPSIIAARANPVEGEDTLDTCINANIRRVVNELRTASDPIIGTPIAEGRVRVVGARYDLDTGSVDFFDLG